MRKNSDYFLPISRLAAAENCSHTPAVWFLFAAGARRCNSVPIAVLLWLLADAYCTQSSKMTARSSSEMGASRRVVCADVRVRFQVREWKSRQLVKERPTCLLLSVLLLLFGAACLSLLRCTMNRLER